MSRARDVSVVWNRQVHEALGDGVAYNGTREFTITPHGNDMVRIALTDLESLLVEAGYTPQLQEPTDD